MGDVMMEPIKVTSYAAFGTGDVFADLSESGMVRIYIEYDVGKQKPEIFMSPEEWDRLVAWVEWQRRDRAIDRGDS
jgi:hypothetical protein